MTPDQTLQANLEQPSGGEIRTGVIQFSGWCFHRTDPIRALRVVLNGVSHEVEFGWPRPDVGRAFPECATASHSGFHTAVSLPAGTYTARLEADVAGLGKQFHEFPGTLEVRAFSWRERTLKALPKRGLIGFAAAKAMARLARGDGWPSPGELRRLLRAVKRDHQRTRRRAPTRARSGGFQPPEPLDPYAAWLAVNRFGPKQQRDLSERLSLARSLPLISVVTPVYKPDRSHFKQAAASLQQQVLTEWEWCVADDASRDQSLDEALRQLAESDKRIRVVQRETNGHICLASNDAAGLASGEFLAFLDQDDCLSPDALGEVALHLASHPDVDVLYTDDDKVDSGGRFFDPQFKPGWSPETLLSCMYMSHLLVIRKTLFERVGGFRVGFEGSQDHDLALRATEVAREVAHLPLVTYHWRAAPGSTAQSADAKPYAYTAAVRAVRDALERRGVPAEVERPPWAVKAALGIVRHRFPDDGPSVAILIANRNNAALLQRCLTSLERTTYRNVRVFVVDDNSDDPDTLRLLDHLGPQVIRGPARESFNFAALNNYAAARVDAEFLLFLNNDVVVRTPTWLSQMVGFGRLEGVGAVGARLLFPNDTIQHAGVLASGGEEMVSLPFRGLPASDFGYMAGALTCRNYSAVTAACMLTPRSLFLEIGGFDADTFPVSFNDVDYCYRLSERGLRCVYAPEAELRHDEGTSRGLGSQAFEVARLRQKFHSRNEPYLNPNLAPDGTFEIQARRVQRRSSTSALRTVFFSHALDLTGAPRCLLELAEALKAKGVVDPCVVSQADGPLRKRFEESGIPVHIHPVNFDAIAASDAYPRLIKETSELLASLQPSVICANTLWTFHGIAAARDIGVPSIWSIRESEPWESCYASLGEPLASLALRCFDSPYRVVFCSHASRGQFVALDHRRNFTVVHDGLDRSAWDRRLDQVQREGERRGLDVGDRVMVLLLGTVCERKGQLDLALALGRLPADVVSRVECFFVGDRPGGYSRRLHAAVAELAPAIAAHVHVLPECEDVERYYSAADVFVCTSRVESYPKVTLEAMASGLPIISTPVFGLSEQLRTDVNAMIYEPRDLSALATALSGLVRDDDERDRLRRGASIVLDCLTSFDEMVDTYTEVLREASEV